MQLTGANAALIRLRKAVEISDCLLVHEVLIHAVEGTAFEGSLQWIEAGPISCYL
jgi:hypothetical protein